MYNAGFSTKNKKETIEVKGMITEKEEEEETTRRRRRRRRRRRSRRRSNEQKNARLIQKNAVNPSAMGVPAAIPIWWKTETRQSLIKFCCVDYTKRSQKKKKLSQNFTNTHKLSQNTTKKSYKPQPALKATFRWPPVLARSQTATCAAPAP